MNSELIDLFKNQISYFSHSSRSYFDSSSFTLITDPVLDAVTAYYKAGGSRPSTGLYPGTSLASVTIENCRSSLTNFFNISSGEILFPTSRGAGVLQVLYSLSLQHSLTLLPYTGLDHDIWLPVFEFSHQKSVSIVPLEVKNTISNLEDHICKHLEQHTSTTNIIILPLTSLGNGLNLSISFLRKIKSFSNTFIILDCTFAVGVSDIKFSDLPIDAAVFDSNIGLGGPIGSGIMYVAESFLDKMHPYVILGNGTITKVKDSSYTLEDIPQRLESDSNPAVLAGLTKSIEILEQISLSTITSKVSSLKEFFLEQILKNRDLKLLGSSVSENYHNILGFVIPSVNMHEVAMFLDEVHNIDIRSGSFCAHQLVDQLYSNLYLENSYFGILQVSFHYYTTTNDIEKLFVAIHEFLNIFK